MIADADAPETADAKPVWSPAAGGPFGNINAITWTGDHFTFSMLAKPTDESNSYYSLPATGQGQPVQLTTTVGIIEDATAAAFSKDGKTLFYCTNASDIDRRHIWAVPVAGGTPVQVTTGPGIENVPAPLASGKQIAVLSADAKRPMSVALWPSTPTPVDVGQKAEKVIYPSLTGFPLDRMVVPTNVTLKAEDGVEFNNQLFLPPDLKPGERRRAIIFVHGGPARQMLLGWHYLSFYHVFYGTNQWLANQGYIVLSVNYRSGVGLRARVPPGGGHRRARQLRIPRRAGGREVARGAGPTSIRAHGHLGPVVRRPAHRAGARAQLRSCSSAASTSPASTSRGSARSRGSSATAPRRFPRSTSGSRPCSLVHGDDDRNVNFAQTVGLVQLLRARNVYHELIVFPDDIHETLLHSRWLYTFDRMEAFLDKFTK